MKKLFLFLFLFLIIISSVLGIRVNGRMIFPYEPGKTFEHQLCIIPEGINHVSITPQGILADQIEIEYTELALSEPVCIPYKIKIPTEFEKPGMQKTEIKVRQSKPTKVATISAVVSVSHQVWVDVPYPGKYLEVDVSATNAEAGEVIHFNGPITNKGKETIKLATGDIEIYDWNEKFLGSVETNTLKNLGSQETGKFYANWSSGNNTVGDYKAVLRVDYDGVKTEDSASFKLGSLEVRLVDYTKQVYKKGIVPFRVTAESYWSQVISGIKATVTIFNGTEKMTEFQTLTQNLNPWEKRNLLGYVDTNSLPFGEYNLEITLDYGETKDYNGTLEVLEEPIEEKPASFSSTKLLLTSTIILSIIALILIIILIMSSRKKKF